jgi:predicted HTH domain antitoxin
MATRTVSIRISEDDYQLFSSLAKKENEPLSKTVRELVDLGRVMLAIDKYKKSEASIGKAAKIAGISISRMMDLFKEYNVEANLEEEDYLKSLKTIRKIW